MRNSRKQFMVHNPTICFQAFLAAVITGYILHLYAFTNIVPNSDGIGRVYDLQNMTVSGRWFLQYATAPSGFTQMPTFIGLLSLCFLGLSAAIVVDLLEIKSTKISVLLGMIMVSVTSVGYTFLYLFTASAYCIGIFLAVLCPWFAKKGGLFQLLAVVTLAFSMGIYQAYAPLAIALFVVLVIQFIFTQKATPKATVALGMPYVVILMGGAGLYYLILQLVLTITNQQLLSYLGMEQGFPFSQIPQLILSAYKQVVVYFFVPERATTTWFLAVCHVIVFGLGGVALLSTLKKNASTWRYMAVLGLCFIFPLAVGFGQIISPWSAPTPLMQYPYVGVYLLVLCLLDSAMEQGLVGTTMKKAIVPMVVLVVLGGGWMCNLLYTASAQAHRATESYVTRLLGRIESVSGYQSDMPVYIVGAFPENLYYHDIFSYGLIDHYSAPTNSVLPLNKHVYYYLNDWLNIPIEHPSEEDMIAMSSSEYFQAMPLYPDDGSVAVVDGVVVAKIAPEYQPKSDYEIAYEKRK